MAEPKQAIVLCGFPKPATSPSSSGFCQKLELYLRVASVTYTHEETFPFSSPTGKLPYARIGGEVVADSHDVIRRLIGAGLARDLNSGLTAAQAAESRAWQAYVEELLYPRVVYERWCVDANFTTLAAELGATMPLPWPLSWLLPRFFRRRIGGRLAAMGVGDRGQGQVLGAIEAAVRDVEARLGGAGRGVFFFGREAPAEVDVGVGGFMMNVLSCAHNPTAAAAVLASPRILALTRRLTEDHFPEYEDLLRLLRGA
jgi:hypothetical protein